MCVRGCESEDGGQISLENHLLASTKARATYGVARMRGGIGVLLVF